MLKNERIFGEKVEGSPIFRDGVSRNQQLRGGGGAPRGLSLVGASSSSSLSLFLLSLSSRGVMSAFTVLVQEGLAKQPVLVQDHDHHHRYHCHRNHHHHHHHHHHRHHRRCRMASLESQSGPLLALRGEVMFHYPSLSLSRWSSSSLESSLAHIIKQISPSPSLSTCHHLYCTLFLRCKTPFSQCHGTPPPLIPTSGSE